MKSICVIAMIFGLSAACSNTDLAGVQRSKKSSDASDGGGGQDADGGAAADADGDGDAGPDAGGDGAPDSGVDGAGWDSGFTGSDSDSSGAADGVIGSGTDSDAARIPQFGLLANDLTCGLCHMKVNGDIVSTGTVSSLWDGSHAEINGTWWVAGDFNAKARAPIPNHPNIFFGANVTVNATGGIKPSEPTAALMPKDLDGNGMPDFPTIPFSALASKMTGRLTAKDVDFKKVYDGNVVVVGTEAEPIRVVGEVLIQGDLVIKGRFTGVGNIYVTGNVYIPADLIGQKVPFPYPEDRAAALKLARTSLRRRDDALGIATPKSVIISDIESRGIGNQSVFEHDVTPPQDRAAALGVYDVYSWIGGKTAYDQLYEPFNAGCTFAQVPGGPTPKPDNHRSISRIDAFLYAGKAVAGRANHNSLSLNGGVIADHFHVITAAQDCAQGTHPVHEQDQTWSYINYDWRMQKGLMLLKQLREFF